MNTEKVREDYIKFCCAALREAGPESRNYKRQISIKDQMVIRAAFWCLGGGTAHTVCQKAKELGLRKVHPRAIAHVLRNAAVRRTLETVPRPTNPRTTQQSWVYHAR